MTSSSGAGGMAFTSPRIAPWALPAHLPSKSPAMPPLQLRFDSTLLCTLHACSWRLQGEDMLSPNASSWVLSVAPSGLPIDKGLVHPLAI